SVRCTSHFVPRFSHLALRTSYFVPRTSHLVLRTRRNAAAHPPSLLPAMDEISEQVTNDQELLDPGTLSESVPDFLRAAAEQLGVIETELVLDGRLVIGEIRYTGVTRSLVVLL